MIFAAALASACVKRPVVIFASSTVDRDVLIRIESETTSRTWLLDGLAAGDLEYRSEPYESATVSILDPETCERLWRTRLPRASAVIAISPGREPGVPFSDKVSVVVGPDNLEPDPPLLEESVLCADEPSPS